CRRSWRGRCSCRWCRGAPTAPAWAWRWPSRSRASTAAAWPSARGRGTRCSPCCCRTRPPRARRLARRPSTRRRRRPPRRTAMGAEGSRVWVVDDDRAVRFVLATALRDAGYEVTGFESAADVLATLDRGGAKPQLLFTDVRMPGDDGLVLLDELKRRMPALPVVVMSAHTDVASTAGAFRGGAQEFLSKPFDLDDAVALAARALGDAADAGGDGGAGGAEGGTAVLDEGALIGDAPAMQQLFRAIGRLAQAPLSVLVTGETGTGKELVARALHRESPRARASFVALNTAAIPSELLESELFGHEAGAFTGAQRRHVGRFEQADGGTLFLDEIGDMPLALQTRLLRVLAEGEFFRVGGRELI